MSLADDVLNWSWWSSPEWKAYCAIYGSEFERPVKGPSYVVDLTSEPWEHYSDGHRSAIKTQVRAQHVSTTTNVDEFHEAHRAAVGGETRVQSTWDLMQEWVDLGQARCVTNGEGGWAYVVRRPPGAYYFSAAGGNCHLLQHSIILALKDARFDWYELGQGHTPGIDTFKKGFASVVV